MTIRSRSTLLPIHRIIPALALFALALCPALALESGPYSMEILVDGVPLTEHAARGATYVEALEGREYSVRLTNRTSRRIAVALSVDGLNSIDAKTTAAREASKWILAPHQSITIDGWQTGPSTARRFFFTTEERSYGAWLGKTKNLGVVAAVVFRERRPEPRPIIRPGLSGRGSFDSAREREEAARPPAPEADAAARKNERSKASPVESRRRAEPRLSDELAATGIGRELDHHVRRIRFDAEAHPDAVLSVRYEYHDALVRLGVVPHRHGRLDSSMSRRERARGFEDAGFAPDPFRR